MVYIGNWILNSTRGIDRFDAYDNLQEKIFTYAKNNDMSELTQVFLGHIFPSQAYEEGGIHEAIADYEDAVFFDILAEELARRDMSDEHVNPDDINELTARMDSYMNEFEINGIENISLNN